MKTAKVLSAQQNNEPNSFDIAAEKATPALEAMFEKNLKEIKPLVLWWKQNYMAAGHKRLGRAVMYLAKKYKI